jgi:integrase
MARGARDRRYLNRAIVRALRPAAKVYRVYDIDARRLCVKVYPSGTKVWQYIFTFQRRARFMTLGGVADIDVKAARRLAGEAGGMILAGKDPQAKHMEIKSTDTFGWLSSQYYWHFASEKLRGYAQTQYLLSRYVPKKFQDMPLLRITRKDVKAVLYPIEFKTPMLARQLLSAMSAVFKFGIKEEIIAVNPCAGIERPKPRARSRVLSDSEIVSFWREFGKHGTVGVALKFLLLTGQRPGEVACINRRHIEDGRWWHMPGEPVHGEVAWPGTKNKNDHWLPLPDAALALLPAGDANGVVFADARGPRKKSCYGPLHWLKREMQRTMRKISSQLGVPLARPHDLRRTNGTKICSLLGFGGKDAMNRIQNHKEGGIATVYDHYQYAAEKQRVMEKVADHIMRLTRGEGAEVISIMEETRKAL